MREKLKDKRLQVWLDTDEFDSIQNYSRKNHLTISELIRGLFTTFNVSGFVSK